MKPSERIKQIYESKSWTHTDTYEPTEIELSIMQYLDEQHEAKGEV